MKLTRREFLQSSAKALTACAAVAVLPPSIGKVFPPVKATISTPLVPVEADVLEHIVNCSSILDEQSVPKTNRMLWYPPYGVLESGSNAGLGHKRNDSRG